MTPLLAITHPKGPHVDFAALSPLLALLGGAIVVLLVGLIGSRRVREHVVPSLSLVALGAAIGSSIWRWDTPESVVAGALRVDRLSLTLTLILAIGGIAGVLLAWRSRASREAGHGELHAMLLTCIGGMALLGAAQNTVALFLGLELLSIPLYVLCATEMRQEHSLESGLKYLIVGSVGSATLLYGIALLYGATGATDFSSIAAAISAHGLTDNAMLLTGVALCVAGLAFKASIAPFHQWTPDVYEGAPTPITAFMAVATKVAALGVMLRLFDVALIEAHASWGPALAALATITILVGNVGALGQSSLKRMLAYSSVAQAGYILAGIVVATQLGAQATVFYLAVYLPMNMAAFAVIVAREREINVPPQHDTNVPPAQHDSNVPPALHDANVPPAQHDPAGRVGDSIAGIAGLGRERPWLAWPMTISMLALAGIPATAGFIGKFYLIDAAVSGGYTWLGVVIVVGSMLSLGYYLPVVAAMWLRPAAADAPGTPASPASPGSAPAPSAAAPAGTIPAIAGGSQELDREPGGPASPSRAAPGSPPTPSASASAPAEPPTRHPPEVAFVALLAGAATIALGIVPQPLFNLVHGVGGALGLL